MFWHAVVLLLSAVAALIGRLMLADKGCETPGLRQQALILQGQLGKHPRLMRGERLASLLTCVGSSEQQLPGAPST